MKVVCWTCHAWYDNARDSWSCPHDPIFRDEPVDLTDPHTAKLADALDELPQEFFEDADHPPKH
ncbi:MAG: hypothetical protein WAK55_17415 [Xanthobacteraceae bacterium]